MDGAGRPQHRRRRSRARPTAASASPTPLASIRASPPADPAGASTATRASRSIRVKGSPAAWPAAAHSVPAPAAQQARQPEAPVAQRLDRAELDQLVADRRQVRAADQRDRRSAPSSHIASPSSSTSSADRISNRAEPAGRQRAERHAHHRRRRGAAGILPARARIEARAERGPPPALARSRRRDVAARARSPARRRAAGRAAGRSVGPCGRSASLDRPAGARRDQVRRRRAPEPGPARASRSSAPASSARPSSAPPAPRSRHGCPGRSAAARQARAALAAHPPGPERGEAIIGQRLGGARRRAPPASARRSALRPPARTARCSPV